MNNLEKKKNRYDGLTIQYGNELARKYSKLTLEEQKALHLIFSHIKPFEKNPTTFQIVKVDFFEKLNLTGDDKYKRYSNIANSLILKTFIEIDNNESTSKGVVIYNVEWFKRQPYFEVSLNPKFMPYLEQLIDYYTKLDLDSVVSFKSKYALSLYKYFCSWNSKKVTRLTTKELKSLLGLSQEDYVYNRKFNRALFEKKVINNSLAEINKISNLAVTYKKNKKSNRVIDYEFSWQDKNNISTVEVKKDLVGLKADDKNAIVWE